MFTYLCVFVGNVGNILYVFVGGDENILYVFVDSIGNILYVFVGDDGRLQYILSLPMSECINRVLSCEEKARLFFFSR